MHVSHSPQYALCAIVCLLSDWRFIFISDLGFLFLRILFCLLKIAEHQKQTTNDADPAETQNHPRYQRVDMHTKPSPQPDPRTAKTLTRNTAPFVLVSAASAVQKTTREIKINPTSGQWPWPVALHVPCADPQTAITIVIMAACWLGLISRVVLNHGPVHMLHAACCKAQSHKQAACLTRYIWVLLSVPLSEAQFLQQLALPPILRAIKWGNID